MKLGFLFLSGRDARPMTSAVLPVAVLRAGAETETETPRG